METKKQSKESLTFIDFFAGIGGFRRGLELSGHKCLGFCEYDKFAVYSYGAMHLLTRKEKQILAEIQDYKQGQQYIDTLDLQEREWYAKDIREICAGEMPKADIWTAGFPCQDISLAGKRLGFKGARSSLFFSVTRLIRELKEQDRPKYLVFENVKNFLSINGGYDFLKAIIEMDEVGYDAEWSILNSSDVVPQNRERVYIIGHLRTKSTRRVFPIQRGSGEASLSSVEAGLSRAGVPALDSYHVLIKEATRKGYAEAEEGDSINLEQPNSKTRRGRVGKGRANTLTTQGNQGTLLGTRIRKLTPREYFRLQAWEDDYFNDAARVNSKNQLYKQAGNGVTVTVVQAIGNRL